ncbi:Sec-independent protein translocase subunit TatA [Streptomyces chiangmaiensis]
MFGKLGAPEILLILLVVVLLFGAKRLPGMARSFGQSLRILKSEAQAMRKDGVDEPQVDVYSAAPTLQPAAGVQHAPLKPLKRTCLTGVETPSPLTDTCAVGAAHEGTGTCPCPPVHRTMPRECP